MFIQTTSQLPSVQNDVLTGQYAGLRLYSCNCNTVHFRYARLFLSVQFYFIFLFLSLLFIPPFILFIYYYAFIIFFFFTFFFLPILFVVALCLALCFSSCFHQETTATCIFLFFFLMDREIYHTLCIVYYNNHYVQFMHNKYYEYQRQFACGGTYPGLILRTHKGVGSEKNGFGITLVKVFG